ncbi:MAG TPA: nuclear transport factor 2 family protein [Gemmatimonadales bacterium]|nr:nuclear transport factor 2 family protein [Gemmatimonadales bacterium]
MTTSLSAASAALPAALGPAEQEVWDVIVALNRCWTVEGRPERLAEYFHPRMVTINPVDRERIEGGAAAVASWTGFVEATTIHYWREHAPQVELFAGGTAAVVTYYWEIGYDLAGTRRDTAGRDMFTLVREGGRWWVVADQFSPFPGAGA